MTVLFRRAAALVACGAVLLTGCVDNQANAREFCDAHAGLLATERDGEELTADEAAEIEDDIGDTMRHAEDATRSVRGAARDLLAAYRDLAGELDDDVDDERLEELTAELQMAREELREGCAAAEDG